MHMGAIAISRAAAEDAGRVATILARAFARYEPLYTPAAFRATTPAAGEIAARLTDGPTWIAEVGDMSAGTLSALRKGASLYLRRLAVVPAAQRRGIARKLLTTAEQFARNEGCTRLVLSTTPFLGRAIALYESCGFRQICEGPHDLFGTALLTMAKELDDEVLSL